MLAFGKSLVSWAFGVLTETFQEYYRVVKGEIRLRNAAESPPRTEGLNLGSVTFGKEERGKEEGISSKVVRSGVAFTASAREAGTAHQRKAGGSLVSEESSFLPSKSRGRSS